MCKCWGTCRACIITQKQKTHIHSSDDVNIWRNRGLVQSSTSKWSIKDIRFLLFSSSSMYWPGLGCDSCADKVLIYLVVHHKTAIQILTNKSWWKLLKSRGTCTLTLLRRNGGFEVHSSKESEMGKEGVFISLVPLDRTLSIVLYWERHFPVDTIIK